MTDYATAKQRWFISGLIFNEPQHEALKEKVIAKLPHSLNDEKMFAIEKLHFLTKEKASDIISALKGESTSSAESILKEEKLI